MMTSQILKFMDSIKMQKSKHLENERLFFLQMKTFIRYTLRAMIPIAKQKRFMPKLIFK